MARISFSGRPGAGRIGGYIGEDGAAVELKPLRMAMQRPKLSDNRII
jgi:hypothetical protein